MARFNLPRACFIVSYVFLIAIVIFQNDDAVRQHLGLSWFSQRAGIIHKDAAPSNDTKNCTKPGPKEVHAAKRNVWQDLSEEEVNGVAEWLFAQPELNLTKDEDVGFWDNSIYRIELQRPNKTDVLPYMDGINEDSVPPPRYAHVLLNLRATANAEWADVLVGPLPIDQNQTVATALQPLEFPLTRKTGGRLPNFDADSHGDLDSQWLYKISASIADITQDLCGGVAFGNDNDTLNIVGLTTPWLGDDPGRILRWDTFKSKPIDHFDTQTLLPQGLFFKSDVTGRDPSQWSLKGWLYNNIFYETTEEFRVAYQSPGFQKLGWVVQGDWDRSDRQGPPLDMDTIAPPTMVHPSETARFSFDSEQKYVEWMDFSFYISFSYDTGLSLYDIRYGGERILYELGLQEILTHYAGNDPYQSGHASRDSHIGIGRHAFRLIPGYDCPSYATFMDTLSHTGSFPKPRERTICMFEYASDSPIQRHTSFKYASATSNIYFTIRSVSSVVDYDYTFSYTFFVDGTIAVETQASGYIIGAHYANDQNYGYRIQDHLSGSMHEHVLNFKADFDILGTSNSVQAVRSVPITEVYPWSDGKARNTMRLERTFVTNEDQGRWNWDGDSHGQKQMVILNQDAPNKYGESRGYRLVPQQPGGGKARTTIINSTDLGRTAGWSAYDVHITAQHDYEPRSTHSFNILSIDDPPIDFDRFFNGENLEQTDLVVWFNLGMLHVPHTGDLPNTLHTAARAGVKLMPLNFFPTDQSRRTVNQVRIDYDGNKVTHVETFGRTASGSSSCSSNQRDSGGCCGLNSDAVLAELWNFTGPV